MSAGYFLRLEQTSYWILARLEVETLFVTIPDMMLGVVALMPEVRR